MDSNKLGYLITINGLFSVMYELETKLLNNKYSKTEYKKTVFKKDKEILLSKVPIFCQTLKK